MMLIRIVGAHLFSFMLLVVLLYSCAAKEQKKKPAKVSTDEAQVKQGSVPKHNERISDTIYSTETVKIIGDTVSNKHSIDYAYIKFEPYIRFSDFKVKSIYRGKPSPIRYNSNPVAREYKTRITETYQSEGINYAGHYTFVWWGCGSPCKSSVLVDVRTGKVYDGPTSELGYDFRKDSRMLIVNPPEEGGFYADCLYCHPRIYIWNEQSKTFEERLPSGS